MIRDTRRRSIVKSIIWRIIGVIILGGLSYVVTKSWETTTLITVSFHTIRVVLYYYHERFWERIKWGRNDNK